MSEEHESRFGVPMSNSHGQSVLFPSLDGYLELVKEIKADGFEMCIDLTAVDYLEFSDEVDPSFVPEGIEPQRFEVVVNLLSMTKRERFRIRLMVPEDNPSCDSIVSMYPGAENMEREAFDLVGIRFRGHPDLTRILMPEDWEGHPLRKDYGHSRIPVQFKHTQAAVKK